MNAHRDPGPEGWREPGGCCLLPGRDGLVHCLVDAEDLRQPGDPDPGRMGRRSHSRGVIPATFCHIQPRSVIMSIYEIRPSGVPRLVTH